MGLSFSIKPDSFNFRRCNCIAENSVERWFIDRLGFHSTKIAKILHISFVLGTFFFSIPLKNKVAKKKGVGQHTFSMINLIKIFISNMTYFLDVEGNMVLS